MMTLSDYHIQWHQDAPILPDDLDGAARNVPALHAKYWRFYAFERQGFKEIDLEYKTLYKHKYEWYNGKMIDEDRIALGWPVNHRRILPAQMTQYLDADPLVQALQRSRSLKEDTLKFLEDVIKQINGRGFHISNAINYLKFKMGV